MYINEYPTMHYFRIPRRSIIAYKILTEYFWKFQWLIALWECCWHTLLRNTASFLSPFLPALWTMRSHPKILHVTRRTKSSNRACKWVSHNALLWEIPDTPSQWVNMLLTECFWKVQWENCIVGYIVHLTCLFIPLFYHSKPIQCAHKIYHVRG